MKAALILPCLCVATVVGFADSASGASCCLRADMNGDLATNLADVPRFVNALLDPTGLTPQQFCGADANADGVIDGGDVPAFTAIILDPTLALFDYGPGLPNAEAEQIALEELGSGGPLLPPDEFYLRIDRDLGLIRMHTPALAPETHSLAWAPNQLIVNLVPGQPLDEYNCLNTYYRMTNSENLFGDWYVLTFAGNLNVPALGEIYVATDAVQFYDPNGFFGGQNFWNPTDLGGGLWRWTIDDGFHDCFDGCDCHRLYEFDVTAAGDVSLVSYQEFGQSWCRF